MAFSNNSGNRSPMSDINVTPLVDVMLVLLIIFMVTAPLTQLGIPVDLPKTRAQSLDANNEQKLVLTLTKDRQIFLGTNEVPIPYEELEPKLLANAKLQESREVYLHADRGLEYGFVVDIMATLKRAGVEQLGMVTDPVETK